MTKTNEIEAHLTALFSGMNAPAMEQGKAPVSISDLEKSASARRQLHRQESVFHSLVENATDAIAVSDLEGNQSYNNRACYDLFGYDYEQQEMEALPLSDLWPKRSLSALTEQILPRARKGGSWSGEARLERKNGDTFDAYLTAFPVTDGTDEPSSIAIIVRDISEQKALDRERMLERRARQVQLVTEVSQEIASATSLDELYRRVVNVVKERLNYWHVQVFRHDPEQSALILVETCAQAEDGMEDAEQKLADARGAVVAAAASGQPALIPDVRQNPLWVPYPDLPNVQGELAVPIKLGDQVLGVLDVLSNRASTLSREDEILLVDLAGQVASAIDSTRMLEEANFLRRFADATEGIGWITLQGSLFVYANSTLSSILGEGRPEDTFGKSLLSYYPDEQRRHLEKEIIPTVMREGQWSGELTILSAWGKEIPTMQSIFLVRDDVGEPIYLANVVTDISEQKQAESAAYRRIRQIACLNDIGRRTETEPKVSDFLKWLTTRIPAAMEYSHLCTVAIEFEREDERGRTICGQIEAIDSSYRVVEELVVCDKTVGRLYVSYTQERQFSDDDKMLIGDIARRVSGYIESRRLSERVQTGLDKVRSAHQRYGPTQWAKHPVESTPVAKPAAPDDEEAIPEAEIEARSRWRARSRLGSSSETKVREKLRELMRRASARLFVLVLVILLLTGIALGTQVGIYARGVALTPTSAALAKSSYRPVVISAPHPVSTTHPTLLPYLTDVPADPVPTSTRFPTARPVLISTYSPTSFPTDTPTESPVSQPASTPAPSPAPDLEPTVTGALTIPLPVEPVPVAPDAVNIVVLGSDQRPDWTEWHTDAVHIVSVQREQGVVSVLSIPRDLYVYIPGVDKMSRINFADYWGEAYGYEGGGPALVRDTLMYNLGIRADHFVRTNFDGLIGIVDTMGGIDIPVHCGISDHWPYPDENGEYPILEMEPGVQHMDGETALWYSRSRMTTSTFSREGRQQQVLQALWHEIRAEITLAHIPDLWEQGREMVVTDMTLPEIVELAPLALALEDQNVRFYSIGRDEVEPWTTPYGGAVFLPQWEAIQPIVAEAMAPVPVGRLDYSRMPIEVWNGTYNEDWDTLAADRLNRAGFTVTIGEADRRDYARTRLILRSESTKGSGIDYLQRMFNVPDSLISHQPDASSEFGIRLIVGADYQTCPNP
jgi:LCP family protein required for cell wall assembly/PAS domain S-box-containing protein